ncbi:MAG: dihydrolipoyl dehydrogenase, partial [Cytophagaceae bacterium]
MQYDVIVIGSGPGGYTGAIRCAQLGLKTAIIEKYATLGGTCLNVGCIPSKALLDSSEHYFNASHTFAEHGIKLDHLAVDLPQMIARKQDVVDQTTKGIVYLMKKNKIDTFYGVGSFVDANTVKIAKTDGSGDETITGKNIVIATGSKPMSFPSMPLDKKRVITSTEALKLPEIPKHLIIIGAGVIGAELGSVYARLGAKVSFIEFADSMIPTMDKTMGKELQKSVKKLGADFYFKHKVTKVENTGDEVVVSIDTPKGEQMTLTGDYCLVSVGRRPYTDGLNLEAAGLAADQRGKIEVDEHLRTKVPHIYALGDVIRGAMLAHKAEEEGVFIAETVAGQKPHIHYRLIPNVVYTWPEVAAVGYTEEDVKEKGIPYKLGTFPFKALGRARA